METLQLEDRKAPSENQPPAGQLLFSGEIETKLADEEKQGRYTLERVKVRRRGAYEACIRLLKDARPGYEGLRRIGGILGLHHLTVAAIRDEAGQTIDTLRGKIVQKALLGTELLLDRVIDNPGCVPAQALGMTIDQLTRVGQLLSGGATARVEHSEPEDIWSDWRAMIEEKLPEEKQLGADQVREVGASGMGFPAGEKRLNSADSARPGAAGTAAASDVQSVALPCPTEEQATTDTTSDTDRPGRPACAGAPDPDPMPRGGGGQPAEAGGLHPDGS